MKNTFKPFFFPGNSYRSSYNITFSWFFSAFLYFLLRKRQQQFLEIAFPLQTYQCLASFTTPYKPHQLSQNRQEESSRGVSSEVSSLPFLWNIIGQYNSCLIFLNSNVWLDFGQDTENILKSYTSGIKKIPSAEKSVVAMALRSAVKCFTPTQLLVHNNLARRI